MNFERNAALLTNVLHQVLKRYVSVMDHLRACVWCVLVGGCEGVSLKSL